jgi:hypothetical protein
VAPCRKIARHECDGEQQQRCQREGGDVVCADFVEQACHQAGQSERGDEADRDAGDREQKSMVYNHVQDVAALSRTNS